MNILAMVPTPILAAAGGGLVLAAALSGWWINDAAHDRGVAGERAKWQAAEAANVAKVRDLETKWQTASDAAAAASVERDKAWAAVRAPIKVEIGGYAKTPAGAARCPDAVGVRIGQKAIDAANAALAGGPG